MSSTGPLPPIVVSSDRAADVWPYVHLIWQDGYQLYREIMPQDFPPEASKEQEETFLHTFFDEVECHVQGYRFMKSVWFAMAELNFYTRLPKAIKDWFAEKENKDIIHDESMRKFLLHKDVEPSTLFNTREVEKYGEKFLKIAIKGIQWHLEQPEMEPGIHAPEPSTPKALPASPSSKGSGAKADTTPSYEISMQPNVCDTQELPQSIDVHDAASAGSAAKTAQQAVQGEEQVVSQSQSSATAIDDVCCETFSPHEADRKFEPSNTAVVRPQTGSQKPTPAENTQTKNARNMPETPKRGIAMSQKQFPTLHTKPFVEQRRQQSSTWPQNATAPQQHQGKRMFSAGYSRGTSRFNHSRHPERPQQFSYDQSGPYYPPASFGTSHLDPGHSMSPQLVAVPPGMPANVAYPVPGGHVQQSFPSPQGQLSYASGNSPHPHHAVQAHTNAQRQTYAAGPLHPTLEEQYMFTQEVFGQEPLGGRTNRQPTSHPYHGLPPPGYPAEINLRGHKNGTRPWAGTNTTRGRGGRDRGSGNFFHIAYGNENNGHFDTHHFRQDFNSQAHNMRPAEFDQCPAATSEFSNAARFQHRSNSNQHDAATNYHKESRHHSHEPRQVHSSHPPKTDVFWSPDQQSKPQYAQFTDDHRVQQYTRTFCEKGCHRNYISSNCTTATKLYIRCSNDSTPDDQLEKWCNSLGACVEFRKLPNSPHHHPGKQFIVRYGDVEMAKACLIEGRTDPELEDLVVEVSRDHFNPPTYPRNEPRFSRPSDHQALDTRYGSTGQRSGDARNLTPQAMPTPMLTGARYPVAEYHQATNVGENLSETPTSAVSDVNTPKKSKAKKKAARAAKKQETRAEDHPEQQLEADDEKPNSPSVLPQQDSYPYAAPSPTQSKVDSMGLVAAPLLEQLETQGSAETVKHRVLPGEEEEHVAPANSDDTTIQADEKTEPSRSDSRLELISNIPSTDEKEHRHEDTMLPSEWSSQDGLHPVNDREDIHIIDRRQTERISDSTTDSGTATVSSYVTAFTENTAFDKHDDEAVLEPAVLPDDAANLSASMEPEDEQCIGAEGDKIVDNETAKTDDPKLPATSEDKPPDATASLKPRPKISAKAVEKKDKPKGPAQTPSLNPFAKSKEKKTKPSKNKGSIKGKPKSLAVPSVLAPCDIPVEQNNGKLLTRTTKPKSSTAHTSPGTQHNLAGLADKTQPESVKSRSLFGRLTDLVRVTSPTRDGRVRHAPAAIEDAVATHDAPELSHTSSFENSDLKAGNEAIPGPAELQSASQSITEVDNARESNQLSELKTCLTIPPPSASKKKTKTKKKKKRLSQNTGSPDTPTSNTSTEPTSITPPESPSRLPRDDMEESPPSPSPLGKLVKSKVENPSAIVQAPPPRRKHIRKRRLSDRCSDESNSIEIAASTVRLRDATDGLDNPLDSLLDAAMAERNMRPCYFMSSDEDGELSVVAARICLLRSSSSPEREVARQVDEVAEEDPTDEHAELRVAEEGEQATDDEASLVDVATSSLSEGTASLS